MRAILKPFFYVYRIITRYIKDYFSKKRSRKEYNSMLLRIILIITITLLLVQRFRTLQRLLVLVFFIVLNFLFAFIKRRIPGQMLRKYLYGIELVLICTLATSVSLGPMYGLVMGPLLMVINYIAERRPSDFFIVTVVLYSLIGYFSYFFRTIDFFLLGAITVLIYNALSFILSKLLGANIRSLSVFVMINILSNIVLFWLYGDFFLGLLK